MVHSIVVDNGYLTDDVKYSNEDISKALIKAQNKLCQDITVPGFRKGKAPLDTAKMYIKSTDLENTLINCLLGATEGDLNNQKDFTDNQKYINFSVQPNIDILKLSDTEGEIKIIFSLYPVLSKLGEYKNVVKKAKLKTVSQKDMDEEIKQIALDNADLVETDGISKNGDTLNIDFEGFINNEKFDGGSAKGFDIEIGSNKFVPGFEDQLINHKSGDKFDVKVKLPDSYPEPLTSKDAVFKVIVNSVKTKDIPEITDDFVSTLSGDLASKNVAEFKDNVKKVLEKRYQSQYKNDVVNEALVNCRESSSYVISEEVIKTNVANKIKSDEKTVNDQGLELDEYLKLVNKTRDDYDKEVREGITSDIKSALVYQKIAEVENITYPSQNEIESYLGQSIDNFREQYRRYYTSTGMKVKEADSQIDNYLDRIAESLISNKINNLVFKYNSPDLSKDDSKESVKDKKAPAKNKTESTNNTKSQEDEVSSKDTSTVKSKKTSKTVSKKENSEDKN